jgi:hypothetical protein
MARKATRYVARSTAAGGSGVPGGFTTLDLNNASYRTVVLTAATAVGYRRTDNVDYEGTNGLTPDGEKTYNNAQGNGVTLANSSGTQAGYGTNTDANAGMMGGSVNMLGPLQHFDDPGVYDLRMATGHANSTVSSTAPIAVFDGDAIALRQLFDPGTPYFWVTGQVRTGPVVVINATDLTTWRSTTGSITFAADCPSGTNTTYTDGNGNVWTRLNRPDGVQLTAEFLMRAPIGAATTVGDVNQANVSVNTWGGNSVEVRISGRYGNVITLYPLLGGSAYFRGAEFTYATPFTLADVTVADQLEVDQGSTISLNAGEPAGLPVAKINWTSGAPDFSLSGDLATYYTVTARGADYWLYTTASRIPDALAGERSLIISQHDAEAAVTDHDTTITVTVVSSDSKPLTGLYSEVMTSTWLTLKIVKDLCDARTIIAPDEEAADVTYQVSSGAQLISTWNSIPNNGALKYEIQLLNGTYTGGGSWQNKDLGTGWLRIKPAAGNDPDYSMGNQSLQRHVRWTGIKFVNDPALTGDIYCFRMGDPGATGINGLSGRFAKVRWDNNRIGMGFQAGFDGPAYAIAAPNNAFCVVYHSELFEFTDNILIGNRAQIQYFATRLAVIENNDTQWSRQDFIQMAPFNVQAPWASTRPWADNNCHTSLRNNVSRNEIDFANYANAGHTDFFQVLRSVNANDWVAGATSFSVSTQFQVNDGGPTRTYQVVTAGVFGSTAPSSLTGLNETNGTAVVKYINTIPECINYIWLEGNTLASDGPAHYFSARQLSIHSDTNRGHPVVMAVLDNASANSSSIGVQVDEGTIYAERNSLYGPPDLGVSQLFWTAGAASAAVGATICAAGSAPCKVYRVDVAGTYGATAPIHPGGDAANGTTTLHYVGTSSSDAQTIFAGQGDVYVRNCITAQAPYAAIGRAFLDGNVVVRNITSTSDPNDVMNGPFEQIAVGIYTGAWHFPWLAESSDVPAETVAVAVRSALRSIDNETGIYVAGDASPPSSYTMSLSVGPIVAYPTDVTVTVSLDAPATEEVVVTIATNLTGAFPDGTTITILVGETTGSLLWEPSAASSGTFTASDDAGLTDPAAVALAQEPPGPTSYTLALDLGPQTEFPDTATLTATLNTAATETVVITIACTLDGVFAPAATITILEDATSGSVTFVPSETGLATFSATDDQGLTDPASVSTNYADTAPPPTSYTLVVTSESTLDYPGPVTFSISLDQLATTPVDFNLSCTLSGDFDPAATISVGNAAVEVTWTATETGEAEFTVTTQIELDGPREFSATILDVPTRRGGLLRYGIK